MVVETKAGKKLELPMLDLKGKPYLAVAWRIVWFREDHPDWTFEVTYPIVDGEKVMAKAQIVDESGRIRAVAHKVEHFKHFADAFEKAETGAIGRALGMLGYGTQFAVEFDEEDRVVDAPIEVKQKESQPINYADLGSTMITFGKYSGKRLVEIDLNELLDYHTYIMNASKGKKSNNPATMKIIDAMTKYLQQKNLMPPSIDTTQEIN
jgi:hypothetical protein